jgi:acetylornithine deacetylase
VIKQKAAESALAALDLDGCVRLAQELIRIPSVTGEERSAQERAGEVLSEAGLEVDRFEPDVEQLRSQPRFPGMEVDRKEAVLVAGVLGPKGDRSLILNGHIDVVPPGERNAWHASPWSGHVQHGWLFGRGAADMKAGLAVGIASAAALKKSGLPMRGRLIVQSVVGEEDGGLGTFAMIQRGFRADAAIILEPTRLRLIPAQAGALSFRLRVSGEAAHASVRYEGVSALEKFQVVRERLMQLERTLNENPHPLFAHYPIPYALSIGMLRSGSWSAMVPDWLECEGRIGVPIGMASSKVRALLEEAVQETGRQDSWLHDHPPQVQWFGGQFDPAEVDPDLYAFHSLREAHRAEIGVEAELDGAPYGSDMRLFLHEAEMPAILYGPGDIRQAHHADEWISVEELKQAARIITAAVAGYLAE